MTYDLYSTKYKTHQGETWDMISQDFYGTPFKMNDLIACNPNYADVLIFNEEVELNIPILEESSPDTLPPWKRGD